MRAHDSGVTPFRLPSGSLKMRILKFVVLALLLVAVGCGVYLWRLPADVGYRYGAKRVGAVALSGLSGTVWDGHADGISVLGNDLGEVDWHLPKLPALQGKPVVDLRIKGSDVELAGQLERLGHGQFGAHSLRFSVPASMFERLFTKHHVKLQGTVQGVFDDALLSASNVQRADGNMHWSGVGISSDAGDLRMSDLLADFSTQGDGSIAGTVKDDGNGALALNGRFTLRAPQFDAEATLRSRDGDEQMLEFLRSVGEPQPDGSTIVRAHGSMLPSG